MTRRNQSSVVHASTAGGFTAIELLTVVAVVALLAAVALPNFSGLAARYRVKAGVQSLAAGIYFARTEAIKRGGKVTLRKANSPDCDGIADARWNCGWLIFADEDEDGLFGAGDTLLQSDRSPPGIEISVSPETASLTANRWGEFNELGVFRFVVKPDGDRDAERATALCMNAGGRLRTLQGVATCS